MESPQPGGYSLADDYNSKYSAGTALSADPTTHTSWAQRKTILLSLLASAVVYNVQAGLSATNEGTGKTFFGFGWQSGTDVTVRIGSLFKMVCDTTTCLATSIPANDFGQASSKSPLMVWYAMHLLQLVGVWLACLFMLFAPHPRTDSTLQIYRWGLRVSIVVFPASLGLAYALLSTLANTQSNSTLGVGGLVIEATSLVGVSFSLFLASRLVRDPHWIYLDDERRANKTNLRRRAQLEAKERRKKVEATKSIKRALGKDGVRALTMNRLMGALGGDKGAQPSSAYPMQPPTAAYSTPQASGYSYAMPTPAMPAYYPAAQAQTPYYGDMSAGGYGYTPQQQPMGAY